MSATAAQVIAAQKLACYLSHPDLTADSDRYYFKVYCRYPRPLGSFVVNVTAPIDCKQSAIDAVFAEIGIVTVDRVESTPF